MANVEKKIRRRREPRFDLIAGNVCLDFINTLDDRFSKQPKELLTSYIDLARFSEDAGALSAQRVDRLFALSQQAPEEAAQALSAAIQLREAAYAVIAAVMDKKPVPQGELYTLNQYVQEAAQHSILVPSNGKFEWALDEVPIDFSEPLWPIARSVAELLSSDQLAFVRACASETCQWFFLDTSKNHGRRWCDMTRCGNRAKARAFYERKKKE
jgi:predicted RNA-binding Zn ribbon-like protein